MVIEAAFEVARAEGIENVNARTVSQKLGCSTQPVMYHFATIEDMKKAAYERVDRFQMEYLMRIRPQENVVLGIGLNYIRFALEEPYLFRFLFQSGFAAEKNVLEIADSEGAKPILSAMQTAMGLNREQTEEVFITLAMFVHGYASIIANNAWEYDENTAKIYLKRVYRGAVLALQGETPHEKNV